MKNSFKLHILLLAALVCTVATSCDHKELCYDHTHAVPARIDVDWSLFTQEQPTGMTVLLYPDDGGQPYSTLTNNTQYADINVPAGQYSALVYNQSTSEFGTLLFDGMDHLSTAVVKAGTMQSRWYKTRTDDERLVYEPEWIASAMAHDVEAPVEESYAYTRDGTRCVVATLQPRCMVYTIYVSVHINNIYNLRSARASLDGLADGYNFGAQQTTTTKATQLIEDWTLTRDTDNPANGTLHATIHSFGLPEDHANTPDDNHLRLSLLLVDNKTQKDFDFAVGNAFVHGPEVSLSLSINESIDTPLPDVKPEGGSSSGFDATVEDWGDEVNIDIGM